MKKHLSILLLSFFVCLNLLAQKGEADVWEIKNNVSYISPNEKDTHRNERCKLDIYYSKNAKGLPVVVWFHGGGLEFGEKHIPNEFKDKGFIVVAVNYRLSPKAKNPSYTDDAAESVAWTFKNIESYGGDPSKIFISGHSAGGYLALMVGLDKSYLDKHGIDANKIKGLAPISGQTATHYTIRKERGIPFDVPLVDKYAPLNNVRKGIPPLLNITGDRRTEMMARYEENAYLNSVLKALGNNVELYEVEGFDHGGVGSPGCMLVAEWVKKMSK